MSKIGKKPIEIPEGVEVKIIKKEVIVKGPKGELRRRLRDEIGVEVKEGKLFVFPERQTKQTKAFWGLERALLANMIKGVKHGFEKKLEIQGVGYRAKTEGKKLILEVGFTHPVEIEAPEGITFQAEKNIITVSGIDKQLVGQVAAKIRRIKPPDAYKGKGIRYLGEEIRLKPGKKAVGTTT